MLPAPRIALPLHQPWRLMVLFGMVWCIISLASSTGHAAESADADGGENILSESFDGLPVGSALHAAEHWQGFRGFQGEAPKATIQQNAGRNGTAAMAVSHSAEFRADSWGLTRQLPQPLESGVVWLDCWFHPSRSWTGKVFFDARSDRSVIARIGGESYQPEPDAAPVLRAHAAWNWSYWRTYRNVPLKDDWYRLTMRLDLDHGRYAAWINDQEIGEELPLCYGVKVGEEPASHEPVTSVYLGLGGTPEDPARIDDLQVSRSAPEGRQLRALLPQPEKDLLFRMAVIGDPQVGFSDYTADIIRFRQTVDQVNRSGAELTLVMGDMVHDQDNPQAYQDVKEIARGLAGPVHYVRGNHERLDLYQKYFHPHADFAFVHKGWRFVFLDAIGNLAGLKEKQLAFARKEFEEATEAGEEIVLCLHVSPWQKNEKGRGGYNQIGPGRDELVELLNQQKVLFCLSGHYHRGLWHHTEESTHYMVFGGTAQVKQGWLSWCTFDIYPDRVVVHQKPVSFAYERPEAEAFYNFNYGQWTSYEEALKKYPYLQRGPAVIRRTKR